MSEFDSVEIGKLGKIVTGRTPSTSDESNYGNDYMFIGPEDLHKHFFITNSERMVSEQGLNNVRSCTLTGLSILVGCIGWDMGNVGIVHGKCITNQQINSITNVIEKYNPLYIYYWLKDKKEYLFSQASVTRTPILNKTAFSNIKINIPKDKSVQDKIVNLISALDTKIELNNRINSELEAMAKTIYDYWFIQFDFPDENGKPYKSSGGKMVYNERLKREIPEGWATGSLWDIARYFNGLAMQKFRPKDSEYLPVIKIKEMGEGFSGKTEKASPDITKDAIINDGDILFSWSATLDVKIWVGGRGALNQHIFKVTSEKHPKTFIFFELKNYLNHLKMIAEKRKTTMGHITQDHLKQSLIAIPPEGLTEEANKLIKPILNKQILLKKENLEFTQLRDWLLPMLMNGQATVE